MAAINRKLLLAHITALGLGIQRIAPDGWCLFASVARAVGGKSKQDLLDDALHRLTKTLPTLIVSEEERIAVDRDCEKLLRQGKGKRQMHRQWDSSLCDHLPQVLADVIGRRLHILQVRETGEIHIEVLKAEQELDSQPIRLAHSLSEIGCDHYDLIM
jgi:hypothetical protein